VVTATVVVRSGQSLSCEELQLFCKERMAGFKVPKLVEIVEALPKNASGKILKRDLRIRFSDRASALEKSAA
jgi:fatty-acyl-CoA synthase